MASDSPGATTCKWRSPVPATTPGITWLRAGGAADGSQSAPRGVRPSSCWSRTAAATRPLRTCTWTANLVMPGASASSSRTSWLPAATGTPRPAGASMGPSGPNSVMSTTAGAASGLVRYTRPRCPTTAPLPTNQKSVPGTVQPVPARPRMASTVLRVSIPAARPGAEAPVARATSGPSSAAATTDPASGASRASGSAPPPSLASRARPSASGSVASSAPGAATLTRVSVRSSVTGSGQAASARATGTVGCSRTVTVVPSAAGCGPVRSAVTPRASSRTTAPSSAAPGRRSASGQPEAHDGTPARSGSGRSAPTSAWPSTSSSEARTCGRARMTTTTSSPSWSHSSTGRSPGS